MGSHVVPSSPTVDMVSAMSAMPAIPTTADPTGLPPELNDADYLRDVLHVPEFRSEDYLDAELQQRATDLGVALSPSRPSTSDKPNTSGAESEDTVATNHARSASTESHDSTSTGMTSQHSLSRPATSQGNVSGTAPVVRKRTKSLSFSQYEKYLSKADPNLSQPKFLSQTSTRHERSASIFSAGSSKTGYIGLKGRLASRLKWRKQSLPSSDSTMSCICCREEFNKAHNALQTLPCGHTYCRSCLAVMINQSTTDESKMPPRCCTQPIPGSTIKAVLARDEQHAFLKAVLQYSTPWESRIFCPNASCGEFVPPRARIDPKHPFEVSCRHCRTRVCVMCKRGAHAIGQDCPADWELDAVLRMGERSGWRRCYKCRTLVELAHGCTHMTCRCRAQFCYICGAVWDPVVGCPNFCNGEEEMERRRAEEEARAAELEAEKSAREQAAAQEAAQRARAERRTAESSELRALRAGQAEERDRFRAFERRSRWAMWARQSRERLALTERYADLADKMRDRHSRTEQHLEDRQVEAEMDLRAQLDQSERSIRIRLRHMEAYCHGHMGAHNHDMSQDQSQDQDRSQSQQQQQQKKKKNSLDGSGSPGSSSSPSEGAPARGVTRRHLEELGQQYRLRDGMERRHQSQINVLREKQAQRMEELLERHVGELKALDGRRAAEVEGLAIRFADEEEALACVFDDRKARLQRRWGVAAEVLRRELEWANGVRYAPLEPPEWPVEADPMDEDGLLPSVEEATDEGRTEATMEATAKEAMPEEVTEKLAKDVPIEVVMTNEVATEA